MDPVALLLVVSTALYARGVFNLWRHAGQGRGISYRQVAYFSGGVLFIALALLSPLDELGETSFAAHMFQHEIMYFVKDGGYWKLDEEVILTPEPQGDTAVVGVQLGSPDNEYTIIPNADSVTVLRTLRLVSLGLAARMSGRPSPFRSATARLAG